MPTPISRQALEKVYENALQPFFEGLKNMVQEFDNMFAVIEFPNIDLTLLDSLDTTLVYGLWEFVTLRSLSFELQIDIHFNHYDYELELQIDSCGYHKHVQFAYNAVFTKETQVNCIYEIGRLIIEQVKDKFPAKK